MSPASLSDCLATSDAVRADDDPTLLQAVETANFYLSCCLELTTNDEVAATIDASVIQPWIIIGEDLSVSIDDSQLVAWVDALEASIDSVGGTVSYTRPDGKYVTVSGGTYGWITNGAAIEELIRGALASGFVGSQEIPYKQTAAVFNPGGQTWGARYVDVDLTEQHAYFYDSDGTLIWETDIISGAVNYGLGTPTGVYTVTNKATDQTLIGVTDATTGEPSYETFVSYWIPFIDNMVGLHDATWQSEFGGTLYMTSAGSHGCINLPYDKAEELFGLIEIGDVVVVHY